MKSVFVILGLLVCTEAAVDRPDPVPTGEDLLPQVETSPLPSPTPERPFNENLDFDTFPHEPTVRTPVFLQTGGDLLLEVKETDVPPYFTTLEWRFNNDGNGLVAFLSGKEPAVSDLYSGRVEVSVESFSVKLKNLQKSDSGVYTARALENDYGDIISEYLVAVVDPVSPVNLTVDSVTDSSDSCDLTVTCRSLDSHQISISTTVTCDNTTTCSQEGGERSKVTTSGATLHAYLLNDTIICNYSNRVSWTNDSIVIDHFCHTGSESLSAGVSLYLVMTVILSVGLIIMVAAVISLHVME